MDAREHPDSRNVTPARRKRFWELANDGKLAKEHGVRAIHGDAPYMRLEPDRVYEILLRSTEEVIITPGARLSATIP